MPRIDADAPVLSKLRGKNWEIQTPLPDLQEIYKRSQGVITSGYLGVEYAFDAAALYQEASQLSLGAIAQSVGMPVMKIFNETMKVLDVNVVSEVTGALIALKGSVQNAIEAARTAGDVAEGGEAMAATVTSGVGIAVDSVSWVPIAGWIVKAAWQLGKAVRSIVDIAKSAKDYGKVRVIYPDTQFAPELDKMVINNVIEDLRISQDWSRRFGPPSLGQGQGTLPDYWLRATESGAKEIVRVAGRDDDGLTIDWQLRGWTGFVAGSSYIVRGVKVKNGAASLLGPDLLPSAQKVLLWLWSSILGKKSDASPNMYCVDPDAVRAWSGWIGGLHQYLYDTDDLSEADKVAVMKALDADPEGNKIFGWGTRIKPRSNEWESYRPVKQANALERRQFAFVDTLLTAYLHDDFAALKANPALRDKWKQRKRDLLEHPARCDVDLDNVPDGDYRRELIARGARSPACFSTALGFKLKTLDDIGPIPDANPYSGGPKKSRGAGGIGWVPFLVLGAGAYWAYKRGYFRGLPLIG